MHELGYGEKIEVAGWKKFKPVSKNLGNPIVMFLEPYDGPCRNGPQKTPKSDHFWVFLATIWYLKVQI